MTTRSIDRTPRISVVVPTCRRPALLARCLEALMAQTMSPEAYDILVAEDGASDGTRRVVEACARRMPAPAVRYLALPVRRGPAAARNRGWRAARGAIIAFTDDDCIPSPDWLAAGAAAFADPGVSAVWGPIVVPLPPVPTDWERNVAGLERAPFATANCLYRRDDLVAAGGFDERFTNAWREDSDLHFTVLRRGGRCRHVPEAVVVHPVRPAPWGVSIGLQRNNVFNALLYKKHPALYRRFIQPGAPLRYYTMAVALGAAFLAALNGRWGPAGAALLVWGGCFLPFVARRLRGTSRRPGHVLEMAVTSLVIPPVAVFWRLRGAIRWRVLFF